MLVTHESRKKSLVVVAVVGMIVLPAAASDLGPWPGQAHSATGVFEAHLAWALDGGPDTIPLATERGYKERDGRLQVVVETEAPEATAVWMAGRGAHHVVVSRGRVQAWVPVAVVRDLADQQEVSWIGRPEYAVMPRPEEVGVRRPKAGDATSEGVAAAAADAWHDAGFTGAGVRVGVIDGGFENYEALMGRDLPPSQRVTFRSFGGAANSGDHGTACVEIVYDFAPGVELYLALVSTNIDIENAIRWLQSNRVDVMTMSVGFYNISPGDGTGALQSVIRRAVEDDDVVFTTSAGNSRQGHWQGPTLDSNGDGWVEFAPGEQVNAFQRSLSAGDTIATHIVWNDWGHTTQDYSLHLFRLDGEHRVEVDSADRPQSGGSNHRPIEDLYFTVRDPGRYGIGVHRKSVSGLNDLEVFDGDRAFEIVVEEGSLMLPADSPDVLAVAAVPTSPPFSARDYSSAGPSNGPGGRIDGGLMKPDVSGYDGVETVTSGRFFGTSASAPHVAGAAALIRGAYPQWNQAAVRAAIEERAIDKGPGGQDIDYGWGRLSLGLEPNASCAFSVEPPSASIGAGQTGGTIQVATDPGCFWSASSRAPWLMVAPDSRVGSGIVIFSAQANSSLEGRQGLINIAGIDFVVDQAGTGCEVSLALSSSHFTNDGGVGQVEVTAGDSCEWTAGTQSSWIEITSGGAGRGPGEVEFSVGRNGGNADRLGTITVGRESVDIHQTGIWDVAHRSFVGGVADTAGAEGTRWSTDLSVFNPSAGEATVVMTYRHEGGAIVRSTTLGPEEILEWVRAPASLFGISENSSGAVEISAGQTMTVVSRTYNNADSGTFGQYLPGIRAGEAMADGDRVVLAPLASNDSFRTNIGFVNPSGETRVGLATLFGPDGVQRGSQLHASVEGGRWVQVNRVFEQASAGACDGCYAVAEVLDGGGLWAYASVVDNGSGDPTTIPQVFLEDAGGGGRWLIAGIADVAGVNNTRWKSTLSLVNHGGQAVDARVDYRSSSGRSGIDVVFERDGMLAWPSVVVDLFDLPSTAGVVEISSAARPVATARTYNDAPAGTFGQFLPAVEEADAIGMGQIGVLTQVRRSSTFRTNVGFVNFADVPCEVVIRLNDASGRPLGNTVVFVVPGGSWAQQDRVFQAAGVSSCPLGYAEIEVVGTSCKVWAYASVVDNDSGDPTTIPMQTPYEWR